MIDKGKDVSEWWSANPQTYGDLHGAALYAGDRVSAGEEPFFRQADRRLFDWNLPLHHEYPFDRLFPYERFRGKRVLEIGCGMGAMAALWAKRGAKVTAIDLAPRSIEVTRRRFALSGLTGEVSEADARSLSFADATFDYVYSWGVLHHSPNLAQSLREMMRVLKPGGEFGLMLYHRNSLFYRWRIAYREGFLHNERDFLDPIELASRYTDGSEAEGNPHTWPVTKTEIQALLGPYICAISFRVLGTEVNDVLDYMLPGLGRLPAWMLKPWARRWGWSLWTCGTRA